MTRHPFPCANVKTALVMSVAWLAPAMTWSWTSQPPPPQRETVVAALGSPHAAGTSRDYLRRRWRQWRRAWPGGQNAPAAVTLADALLRLTRVTGNAGLATGAEAVLAKTLAHDPEHYQARRVLAAVYLSEHRFRDAIGTAERCLQGRRDDPWSNGVVGDAHLELGDYDRAFAAFDRMLELRPMPPCTPACRMCGTTGRPPRCARPDEDGARGHEPATQKRWPSITRRLDSCTSRRASSLMPRGRTHTPGMCFQAIPSRWMARRASPTVKGARARRWRS